MDHFLFFLFLQNKQKAGMHICNSEYWHYITLGTYDKQKPCQAEKRDFSDCEGFDGKNVFFIFVFSRKCE